MSNILVFWSDLIHLSKSGPIDHLEMLLPLFSESWERERFIAKERWMLINTFGTPENVKNVKNDQNQEFQLFSEITTTRLGPLL